MENLDDLFSHKLLGSLITIAESIGDSIDTAFRQSSPSIKYFINPADLGLAQRTLVFGKDGQEIEPLDLESIGAFCTEVANMIET